MMINAPTMFALAWRIVKTWLDERTKEKIGIYSNEKAVSAVLLFGSRFRIRGAGCFGCLVSG